MKSDQLELRRWKACIYQFEKCPAEATGARLLPDTFYYGQVWGEGVRRHSSHWGPFVFLGSCGRRKALKFPVVACTRSRTQGNCNSDGRAGACTSQSPKVTVSWGLSYNGLHCSSKPSYSGALQAHRNTHWTSRAHLWDSNHGPEGKLVCDCVDRKTADSRTHTQTHTNSTTSLRLQPAISASILTCLHPAPPTTAQG